MSHAKLTPQQLLNIRDSAAHWGKMVARRAYGASGPGLQVGFADLEQVAAAAARGLTEGTLAALLELQSAALPSEQPCPDCGQPGPVTYEPRELASPGGTVLYREPVCHCPACRRDFFPSTPGIAARRPSL